LFIVFGYTLMTFGPLTSIKETSFVTILLPFTGLPVKEIHSYDESFLTKPLRPSHSWLYAPKAFLRLMA